MIRDRYAPPDRCALVPSAGRARDPVLARLDLLLDDDDVYQRVRADLATPVEVLLRLLVIKRLYGWRYEEAARFVADSLVRRRFCRAYLRRVPDDTTRIRWANLSGPATVAARNDRVVALAQEQRVTRGRKLRIDGTVVETTIRYPTDRKTRGDGVRARSRLRRRAKGVLGDGAALGQAAFRTRTRSVRRLTPPLPRGARRKGEQAAEDRKQAYAKRIGVAPASRRQAQRVATARRDQALDQGQRVAARFDQLLPVGDQAIAQATRRVRHGETVPAADKLLRLFAPHTRALRRHKAGKPTECGRKVPLDEVAGGIVSHFAVLDAVGVAHPHFVASLDAHQERFGHPPDLVAGDRGLYAPENAARARARGVRRVVLPTTGRASRERQQHERPRWFRRGFRFRAGAEGRIHVLKRDDGLARRRDRGEDGFGRGVGWGSRTHNLAQIAKNRVARATRPVPSVRRAG